MRHPVLLAVLVSMFSIFFATSALADDSTRSGRSDDWRPSQEEVRRVIDNAPSNMPMRVSVTPPVSWKFNATYVSDFVALGYANGPALQGEVVAKWGDGWSASLWGSTKVNDSSTDFAKEGDIELMKDWGIGKGFTLHAGLAYFALFPLGGSDGDMVRPQLKLKKSWELTELVSITASAKIDDLLLLPDLTSRWVAGGTLAASWKLAERLLLGLSVEQQYDFGNRNADAGWLTTWKGGVSYQVSESVTLEVFGKLWNLSGIIDRPVQSEVLALSFSITL